MGAHSTGTLNEPKRGSVLLTFRDCEVCPEMVELPAGEFMMGSPEGEIRREGLEGPPRRVVLAERVAIGKFEVTVAQFATFVAETGLEVSNLCRSFVADPQTPWGWPEQIGSFQDPGFRVTPTHPAVCVSWNDATAYVAWLSRKTGRAYRLPSEAEWEYAARAGTATAYSFGDDVAKTCDHARFADANSPFPYRSGCASTTFEPGALPVGSLKPNPWGLYDIHGNAWEWVADCWAVDARALPSDGSAFRPSEGCQTRPIRGGGWAAELRRLRSAHRQRSPTDHRYYHLGFRVALSLGPR